MRVFIAYRPNSEHAREVADYLRDFERQTGKKIDEIDPDTREGDHLSRLYDIVQYPTIVATDDDGALQAMWPGTPLPLMDEVSYYV